MLRHRTQHALGPQGWNAPAPSRPSAWRSSWSSPAASSWTPACEPDSGRATRRGRSRRPGGAIDQWHAANVSVALAERRRFAASTRQPTGMVPGVSKAVADRSFPDQIVNQRGRLLTGAGGAPSVGHGWESAVTHALHARGAGALRARPTRSSSTVAWRSPTDRPARRPAPHRHGARRPTSPSSVSPTRRPGIGSRASLRSSSATTSRRGLPARVIGPT